MKKKDMHGVDNFIDDNEIQYNNTMEYYMNDEKDNEP